MMKCVGGMEKKGRYKIKAYDMQMNLNEEKIIIVTNDINKRQRKEKKK